jgi:CO/xanthine dehydrogenase Mo-binding subunit
VTVMTERALLGDPVDRVDGPLKVTGAARYPSDVTVPDLVHAVLVQSTIGAGTMSRIDIADARDAPGVLTVITHDNAPTLAEGPNTSLGGPTPRFPLEDNRILHHGQPVAVVVAETREQAVAAAQFVIVEYDETAPVLGIDNPEVPVLRNAFARDSQRGDAGAALLSADVVYDETFSIVAEINNPIGLFATVAHWQGDRLTVHDSTQWPTLVSQTLATVFGVPEAGVRVLVPYLGGGFGAGLKPWPHVVLTALAARILDRPVKLVLSRCQMFTSIGHRPEARQRLQLGATRDGRLVAIDHEATSTLGMAGTNLNFITRMSRAAYACPNVATHDQQVRLNIPSTGWMRGPGTTEGNFAIESALDELSYELDIDPIELRLRNYAEVSPESGLPWSSNALRECYRVGGERFGWSARNSEIGAMRDGKWLIGYGMAGVTFGSYHAPCRARISVGRDGRALVTSAATDIGTGTYTVATQLAADLLGLDIGRVRVEIGDTDLPTAPQSGGSGLAMALGGAIHDAAANLLRAVLDLVDNDDGSPLQHSSLDAIAVTDGRIHLVDDPSVGETYVEVLARHRMEEITADGELNPQDDAGSTAAAGAFAARFAEVRVDPELGLLRVARLVTAVDGGRVLNTKLARSQIIGSVVMGIGMTMLEQVVFDAGTGRIANASFSDYLIPVNADIPELDVVFVGEPDKLSPIGIKGLGEVGIVGVSAAIANAVYHATGRRIRSLPITIDQLL